jgi:hypothetical protein
VRGEVVGEVGQERVPLGAAGEVVPEIDMLESSAMS